MPVPETFEDLSYTELKARRDLIDALMAKKMEEEQAIIREQIAEKAASLGITIDQLFGKKRGRPRKVKTEEE